MNHNHDSIAFLRMQCRQEKTKWRKCDHISCDIDEHCSKSKQMPVTDKTCNLFKKREIIPVLFSELCPSESLGKEQKVK